MVDLHVVSHKYLSPIVESIEAVKTAISGGVVLVAEPKMPLPDGMGHIARFLEVLWHQGHIDGDTGGHQRLDVHVLTTHPVRVLAGHHGDPTGGAGWLDVVLVEQDTRGRQLLHNWAVDVWVVPRHIIPACKSEQIADVNSHSWEVPT